MKYQFVLKNGDWSGERSLPDTMEAAKNRVPKNLGPYALVKDDERLRRGLRSWVLRGLEQNLSRAKPGPVFRVRSREGVEFTARASEPAAKIYDTSGNDKIDKVWTYGKVKFPDVSYLGAYVCKQIAGTNSPSQHSYGNAIDFGRQTMGELYDLAHYLVANADELDLAHVIVDDRIWSYGSWSHYGGNRHYHVHADCTPQYSGSCGVRG